MKVHVEEEYIRFTISGSDILVSDFIAIYNWTCRYTRDNLHLDLHHLAMIYLIQRSIYTLKEIKLENKELIYHTVLCSGVEPFSISESVGLLHISPLTFTFLSINTSQYQHWALIVYPTLQSASSLFYSDWQRNDLFDQWIMYHSGYGFHCSISLSSCTKLQRSAHCMFINVLSVPVRLWNPQNSISCFH